MSRKSIAEVDRIEEIAMFDPQVRNMVESSGRSFYALYREKPEFSKYCDTIYCCANGGRGRGE